MAKLRVLFVDDEEELVSAVTERLELRGIEAVGSTNGHDALERAAGARFDVVVLDLRMPGLDGLDVIRTLRQLQPELKVVMMSGHGSAEAREEGLRLGAFDYLQKPVDIKHLVSILRRAASGEEADA
ncbi:MAG: response regulator [Pseudomonadota bacterium]